MRNRLAWWWASVVEALDRRLAAWGWLSPNTRAWVGWALALVLAVSVGGGAGLGLLASRGGLRPAPTVQAPAGRPALAQLDAAWFQSSHYGALPQARPGAPLAAVVAAGRLPYDPGQPASGGGASGGTVSLDGTWVPLGPAPLLAGGVQTSGAVTAVAVNPNNPDAVWIGTAFGGVWGSSDGGQHWTPRFASAPSQSIASIALDPRHPTTIYVGTGAAPRTPDGSPGMGILKSTDGGATWTQLGAEQLAGLTVTRIAVDPFANGVVLAATAPPESPALPGPAVGVGAGGIWRSADGGRTWQVVLGDTLSDAARAMADGHTPDAGTDVTFDPAHTGVVYAGVGNLGYASQRAFPSMAGLYRSIDDGRTWTRVTKGMPTGNAVSRVSVAVSRDGGHVYAMLAACGQVCGTSGTTGDLLGGAIYVSGDRGLTWASRSVPEDSGMTDDRHEHGWWYASVVAVDPTTPDTAYVGGRDLWRTTDGGRSWRDLTQAGVGTEEYALAFRGASADFYIGNDAGIWLGGSAGVRTDLNGGGLSSVTVAGASVAVADGVTTLYAAVPGAGLYQHVAGICATCGAEKAWAPTGLASGEVGGVVVDYADPATLYVDAAYGTVLCSVDAGAHWSGVCGAGIGDRGSLTANFVAPLVISPNNHLVVLAGTRRVYRTTNGGKSWTAISPALDGNTPLSALAVARDDDAIIFAGDNQGRIYETSDGGHAWSANLAPADAPARMVTALATQPGAPGIAYAAYAGYAGRAGGHLYKTTDAGVDWKDVSTGLPDAPIESVVVAPSDPRFVVAGTDVGAFYSPDAGSHWYVLGNGLPRMPIDQVVLAPDGSALYVATHGRGVWALTGHLQAAPMTIATTTTAGVATRATVTLRNTGGSVVAWNLGAPPPAWLALSATSGVLAPRAQQTLTLTVTTTQTGTYTTRVLIQTSRADNASVEVPVTVTVG